MNLRIFSYFKVKYDEMGFVASLARQTDPWILVSALRHLLTIGKHSKNIGA